MFKEEEFCDRSAKRSWDSIKDSSTEVKAQYGCDCLTGAMNAYFLDPELNTHWYIYFLMVLSMINEASTFFYIYNFKGLQAHPMKLFMWMSFGTFSYFWLIFW